MKLRQTDPWGGALGRSSSVTFTIREAFSINLTPFRTRQCEDTIAGEEECCVTGGVKLSFHSFQFRYLLLM